MPPPASTPGPLPRVSLHLADNPRDRDRPFAFLATTPTAGGAQPGRHTPLGHLAHVGPLARWQAVHGALRHAAERCPELDQLLESGALLTPQRWTARSALRFLRAVPELEAVGITVRVPAWWTGADRQRVRVRVTLDVRESGMLSADALLDLDVALTLDGATLLPEETEQVLTDSVGLLRLRGQWVEVNGPCLQRLLDQWTATRAAIAGTGLSFVQGMRLLVGLPVTGLPLPAGEPRADVHPMDWQERVASPSLASLIDALQSPASEPLLLPGLRATLRDYQQVGVAWLATLTHLGLGACLADDMGLGKTVQALALLLHRSSRSPRPSLVVVPTSLLRTWQEEAQRFTPGLRLHVAHGSADRPAAGHNADVVLTTYSQLHRNPALTATRWDTVIFDEAQALKSTATVRSQAARALEAHARVVLTGTPMENALEDLWALFDLINPGLLGTRKAFHAFANGLGGNHTPLRTLLAPYLLRREKSDPRIAAALPAKTIVPVSCRLTPEQADLYRIEVAQLRSALANDDARVRSGAVLTSITRFKLICNHPALLDPDADLAAAPPEASGKLVRLRELARSLARNGDKLLVFTQYRRVIPLLLQSLSEVWERDGLALHGGLSVDARQRVVHAFQAPDGPPFLVLSLRAGGTGLNLTAAQHVVHFDRWWNPAVEAQATDRTHRIGQHQPVWVHRFTCRGTIEERIAALLAQKSALTSTVVDANPPLLLGKLSTAELMALVRLDLPTVLEVGL